MINNFEDCKYAHSINLNKNNTKHYYASCKADHYNDYVFVISVYPQFFKINFCKFDYFIYNEFWESINKDRKYFYKSPTLEDPLLDNSFKQYFIKFLNKVNKMKVFL